MNIREYLSTISKKPEPLNDLYNPESLLKLLTPLVTSKAPPPTETLSQQTLNPDQILTSLNSKLKSKSNTQALNPTNADILTNLSKKIKSITFTNNIIKDLASSRISIQAEDSKRQINRILAPVPQRYVFQHTLTNFVFKSVLNDIPAFFESSLVMVLRKRKDYDKGTIEMDDENIDSLKELIKGKEEFFRFHTRRLSALDISKNTGEIGVKMRNRRKTVNLTPKLNKRPNSDSESESDSEEEIQCLCEERIARRDAKFYKTRVELPKLGPFNMRDFRKNISSGPVQTSSPLETSNGEVIKFGYVKKNISGTTNFHSR